jgi:sugar lactone lactonase YvrE
MKWVEGAKEGIVVAGGQGRGNGLTQFSFPWGVVVDQLGTVYVTDRFNDRIMRWVNGATQGSVIVGGNGYGGQPNQLVRPAGLSFDRHGNLYVVDAANLRVQKFNIEKS